jgi:protein-disulfide isomerase
MELRVGTLKAPALVLLTALAAQSAGVLALAAGPAAQETDVDRVLAVVVGETITGGEVRDLAAEALEGLENERLRFEADSRMREHEIVRETLNGMVTDRLLRMESEASGVTVEELLAREVESQVAEPAEAEIQDVYQANLQQLISVPRTEGLARVRQFLIQESYDLALVVYVERLREDYGVRLELGPYRVDVETDGFPSRGPEDAPIVMVEFSDFECPYCRQSLPVFEDLEEAYAGQIRFVYRQFPLTEIHPRAQKAAEASLCADEQGAFWDMHDLLFADPVELETASLKVKAESLGLDRGDFDSCLDSGKYRDRIAAEIREGFSLGVSGTPTVLINGRPLTGSQPYEAYSSIIDEELGRLPGPVED